MYLLTNPHIASTLQHRPVFLVKVGAFSLHPKRTDFFSIDQPRKMERDGAHFHDSDVSSSVRTRDLTAF